MNVVFLPDPFLHCNSSYKNILDDSCRSQNVFSYTAWIYCQQGCSNALQCSATRSSQNYTYLLYSEARCCLSAQYKYILSYILYMHIPLASNSDTQKHKKREKGEMAFLALCFQSSHHPARKQPLNLLLSFSFSSSSLLPMMSILAVLYRACHNLCVVKMIEKCTLYLY